MPVQQAASEGDFFTKDSPARLFYTSTYRYALLLPASHAKRAVFVVNIIRICTRSDSETGLTDSVR